MRISQLQRILQGVDPVFTACCEKYRSAISKTFWSCYEGYEVQQASEALSKRILNIDAITVVKNLGGVGSSLYFAALHARLGRHNHKYSDIRILTDAERLRTVIPTLDGSVACTAQEQPSGKDKIQDDLLKNVAVGEGILGRLPCTILARLFLFLGMEEVRNQQAFALGGAGQFRFCSHYASVCNYIIEGPLL